MTRSQQQSPPNPRQILHELSSLVMNIMRVGDESWGMPEPPPFQRITPAGFASLLLGISLALMLCGSVTFFLGFMLIPWVLPSLLFGYFLGIVSSISMIGKALFSYASGPTTTTTDVPSWKLL